MNAVRLPELAASQLVGFVLVLARVGGIFIFAPVFSSRLIPPRAKLVVGGAVSLALVPLATGGKTLPTDPLTVGVLFAKEAIVGLGFALAIGVIVGAVQAGASLLDTLVGFSFGALVDPMSNQQSAVLGQFYSVFTLMVFLTIGGEQLVFAGLGKSYQVLPIGEVPSLAALGRLATDGAGDVMVIGLQIAAPVIIALLLVEAGLALVARAVPQMNVFVVGMPAKILTGLAVVGASLPFVAEHIRSELEVLVSNGLRALAG